MSMKYLGPMTSQKGLVGATLVNANLIFNAGVRTLPGSAAIIGKIGAEKLQAVVGVQGAPDFPRSKPGQPPKMETGELKKSINFHVKRSPKRGSGGRFTPARGAVSANIFANSQYARDLEFGTSHVVARPFFVPTFHNKGFATNVIRKTVMKRFVTMERFAARKRGTGGLRG